VEQVLFPSLFSSLSLPFRTVCAGPYLSLRSGYGQRFGLYRVDHGTQARTLTGGGALYRDIVTHWARAAAADAPRSALQAAGAAVAAATAAEVVSS
jgi:hypothetical protein